MEFLSLAKQRCSVRKYKTDEIEKENWTKFWRLPELLQQQQMLSRRDC